jgi:folate-dependent phosphoribosylglycinamide formyltransferase PurN
MDKLINRARALLAFMTEHEAAVHLVDSGEDKGDVFLAIKAAVILERG